MNLKVELSSLMAAQVPLIHLVTYEEDRVLRVLAEIGMEQKLGVVSWDIADGFNILWETQEKFPVKDCTTDTLLGYVNQKLPRSYVLVLKDFHHSWLARTGLVTRKLRNMVASLRSKS